MAKLPPILNMVLRAAIWKSTPQPPLVGLPTVLVSVMAALGSSLLRQYIDAGANGHFSPYGLNAEITAGAVSLAVAALFVRCDGRATFLSAFMLLGVPLAMASIAVSLGLRLLPPTVSQSWFWTEHYAELVGWLIQMLWWSGAMYVMLRSVEPERRFAPLRVAGIWLALLLTLVMQPYVPTFRARDFDIRTANWWEYMAAVRDGSFNNKPQPKLVDRAKVELSQPALLDAELSRLAPQVSGAMDIYVIGLAGSADEDVFDKELNGGLQSLAHIFPLGGRIVRLVNRADTITSTPIASRQNFATAVHQIARIMDRDEDVLLLFMTSHGSEYGVALSLPGAVAADLGPADVAAVLDHEGIKNRIVIVSACYSGVFAKPLANEDTIVLTASDEDHPSFGCSNEREWTYFGDAFFNRSLRAGGDIEEAFLDAKVAIAQWEARDNATPSNPQGYFGHALMKKLAGVYLNANRQNGARFRPLTATPPSGG